MKAPQLAVSREHHHLAGLPASVLYVQPHGERQFFLNKDVRCEAAAAPLTAGRRRLLFLMAVVFVVIFTPVPLRPSLVP